MRRYTIDQEGEYVSSLLSLPSLEIFNGIAPSATNEENLVTQDQDLNGGKGIVLRLSTHLWH